MRGRRRSRGSDLDLLPGAIVIALLTAFAYAELVTKYPYAAGAARYVHTAFRQSFFAFMIAFAVMASGITSASAAARVFGGDYLAEFVKGRRGRYCYAR